MKNTKSLKLIKSITFFLFIVPFLAISQVPESFKYQAVVRSVSGTLIANQNVTIKSSILSSDVNGTVVYAETQNVTTTEFGLIHLNIGQGTLVQGSFSAIPWGDTSYFLKTEFDLNGNGNFQFIGVTQLLAVPYALYAKTSGSSIPGPAGPQGPIGPAGPPCLGDYTHFIGEEFGGGVIFSLWKDSQGVEHGLIVDKVDLSNSQAWSNIEQNFVGVNAQSPWDGLTNSNAITAQVGHTNSAAALCLNSTNGGQNDWYLPSIQELHMIWNNYHLVGKILSQIPNATQFNNLGYWSSTEAYYSNVNALGFHFYGSAELGDVKSATLSVRGIRAF